MEQSQIKSFFKNQTIFLTGGSGFLGKVLIEKLLRECEEIEKIYVLIRPKKNKTPEERFEELFSYPCFDPLKTKNANSLRKVSLISGDCQQPLLGLDDKDIDVLIKETTCVIHAAANVKFEQTLKQATCNVRSTRDLLELAKRMKNLGVFVYISTAYSNCIHSHIEEKFYEPPMSAENLFALVNALDDATLQALTPLLLGSWPNTYVYTKSICEDLIRSVGKDLAITIVRPSIVSGSMAEPIPGWIDNLYGIVGISLGAALGLIKSCNAKYNAKVPVVPVDYVSNCILAAAWKRQSVKTTTIYNYVGDKHRYLTWISYQKTLERIKWKVPFDTALWYNCFELRENKIWYNICLFFLHTCPAYLIDFILFCLRKPTIAVKSYQRLHKMMDLLSYFTNREWSFDYDNVGELWDSMNSEDRKLFCFNMENIDWDSYYYDLSCGARLYLLKESVETLPRARRKMKILFVVHYTVVALFYYLLYKLVVFVLGFFL